MHLAAFFAHPDDLDLWAGGTVLRHLEQGDRVSSFLFYECSEARLRELAAARAILRIGDNICNTPAFTPIKDDAMPTLLDDVPDVVITHWAEDVHPEHRLVFESAKMLCHLAKRHRKKTPLLLMSSTYYLRGERQTFEPEILIDITDTVERKVAAIRCYESQHPEHLLADVLAQSSLFGNRAGVCHAEGFVEYPLFGFTRSSLRYSLNDLLRSR